METKIYVNVIACHDTEGNIVPLEIIWEDGRRFEIDRVLAKERRASMRAGGIGWRYTVRIQGKQRYLYHEIGEGEKWFVENKEIYYPEYDAP